jgi:hypothetical protein
VTSWKEKKRKRRRVKVNKHPSEKELEKFIIQLSKLNPIEFMGISKIFNIELYEDEEKKKPRKFEVILSEILDKYISLTPRRRKNMMNLVKSANLEKVDK